MKKKELIVLLMLIFVLIAVNVVNYIKRESLKRNYTILVDEAAIKISINSADIKELEQLPGIGPSLARRIIEYREEHGLFQKLEDLKKVKGIGDKLFEKIMLYAQL